MFLAMVVGPQAPRVVFELACNALVDGAVATATAAGARRPSRTATLIVSMCARRLRREGWGRWRVGM
jgi:hypothetical protein